MPGALSYDGAEQEDRDMNIRRAERIAAHFTPNAVFHVASYSHGLLVSYRGGTAYFVSEAGFWPFIFRLAVVANQEQHVAEIESRLAA